MKTTIAILVIWSSWLPGASGREWAAVVPGKPVLYPMREGGSAGYRAYEVPLTVTNTSRGKISFTLQNGSIPSACVYTRDAERSGWRNYPYYGCGPGMWHEGVTLDPGETKSLGVVTSGEKRGWQMRVKLEISDGLRKRTVWSVPVVLR